MDQKIFNKMRGGDNYFASPAAQLFILLEPYVKYCYTALNSKSTLPFIL